MTKRLSVWFFEASWPLGRYVVVLPLAVVVPVVQAQTPLVAAFASVLLSVRIAAVALVVVPAAPAAALVLVPAVVGFLTACSQVQVLELVHVASLSPTAVRILVDTSVVFARNRRRPRRCLSLSGAAPSGS